MVPFVNEAEKRFKGQPCMGVTPLNYLYFLVGHLLVPKIALLQNFTSNPPAGYSRFYLDVFDDAEADEEELTTGW